MVVLTCGTPTSLGVDGVPGIGEYVVIDRVVVGDIIYLFILRRG